MINPNLKLLCFCLTLLSWLPVQAQFSMPEPNWTRSQALEAVRQIDANSALKPLFRLARESRDNELLRELINIENNSDWPVPAREYVLHAFALGLGDMPAWTAGAKVLAYLEDFEPRTLVPHEDHAAAGVPLFNVRVAAAGSVNEWRRYSAWKEAQQHFPQGGETWIEAFLAAGSVQRRGFGDALTSAAAPQLREIGKLALTGIAREPSLTIIAARTGILLADREMLQQSIIDGRGPGVMAALREAHRAFDEGETEAILRYSMEHARPETASLAMAELGPSLLKHPDVAVLMIETLGNPDLGATAAMLLSASANPFIREQLVEMAKGRQGLASRRAALAVDENGLGEAGHQR